MRRLLLLFLDGVGAGAADPVLNPFLSARLPHLRALLDNELPLEALRGSTAGASLAPLDATLGVSGLPQSGTGQTALLTGLNAPALHGRHHGPWVPTTLRTRLGDESLLARATAGGYDVAFANAYPEEAFADPAHPRRARFLRAGPPLAALAAGLLTRHTAALASGDAVASEIVNDGWREHLGRTELPPISAAQAGANLARIAAAHHLTFFAHYSTDSAGHTCSMPEAVAALELVDQFLGGLLETASTDLLTIVASDHGNIEDVTTGHTRHPALGLVIGDGHADVAAGLHAITDVAPALLGLLRR